MTDAHNLHITFNGALITEFVKPLWINKLGWWNKDGTGVAITWAKAPFSTRHPAAANPFSPPYFPCRVTGPFYVFFLTSVTLSHSFQD
ncbi:MAG: hypothetical protein ACYTFE_03615 [Planctomycetota bacterium]|jgi:hypothetical protein